MACVTAQAQLPATLVEPKQTAGQRDVMVIHFSQSQVYTKQMHPTAQMWHP